jgi:hypothetical protein
MPAPVDIRPLKIHIGPDQITANRANVEQAPIKAKLACGPVQRQTIEMLVRMLRENRLRDQREYEVLGSNLWAVLFDNEIGAELHAALQVKQVTTQLLRVELEFEKGQEELAAWPWEYLFCPLKREEAQSGYFLAKRTRRLLLTRHLSLADAPRTLRVEQPPVRVLFVVASPDSGDSRQELAEVQYQRLLEEFKELQAGDPRIQVMELISPHRASKEYQPDVPPKATYANFIDTVQDFEPHVIHFVGHGRCVNDGGEIAFVAPDYRAQWISDNRLSEGLMDFSATRLVFLQACESALPDPYQAISGMAMKLAHRNIPVVVAMQYRVENSVASLFARAFYRALAESHPVDVAVQLGRTAIDTHVSDWTQNRAFGLPVLYLRDSGALLPSDETRVGAINRQVIGSVPSAATRSRDSNLQPPSAPERAVVANRQSDQLDGVCPRCHTPYTPSPNKNYCANVKCRLRLVCPFEDCRSTLALGEQEMCGKCGRLFDDYQRRSSVG